ncbi:MAG: type II toxin-antitoxin system prevent-host-death family antitoxin [Desulfovibrio sp.]|nr:type II toxin-antitoxin system prevent-host-death family antitoxin [Desulfovibrio sp.]
MIQTIIPIHQAKTTLSQLVKRAVGGETIFIGSYGRAEAALSAAPQRPEKRLGVLEGKLIVPDDFDAPLPPEVLSGVEGRGCFSTPTPCCGR